MILSKNITRLAVYDTAADREIAAIDQDDNVNTTSDSIVVKLNLNPEGARPEHRPDAPVFPHILPILQAAVGMSEDEFEDVFALIGRMFELLPIGARLTREHVNRIQSVYEFNHGVKPE